MKKMNNYLDIIECFGKDEILEELKEDYSVEMLSLDLDVSDFNYKHCDPTTGQKCFRYIDIYDAVYRFWLEEYLGYKDEIEEEFLNRLSTETLKLYYDEEIGYENLVEKYNDIFKQVLESVKLKYGY